jgi:hypothetical protein
MKSYLITIAFLFAVASTNAQSTNAGSTTPAIAGQKEPLVKCLGIQEDMVIFNVSYPNPTGNKFSLIVKDQDGTPLYQSVFSEKNFYKQFRLPKTDKNKISFVIRSGKETDIVQSFEINVSSRFVEDIAIKKID